MNVFILHTSFWGVLLFPLDMGNTGCDTFLGNFAPVLQKYCFWNKFSLLIRDEPWVTGKVGIVAPTALSLSPAVLYQPTKLVFLQKLFKVPQTCFKMYIKYCTNIIPYHSIAILVCPAWSCVGAVLHDQFTSPHKLTRTQNCTNNPKPQWLHLYAYIY